LPWISNFLRVCSGAGPCAGFLGGAARPVRFVEPAGIALPILQQPTAVDDASLRTQSPAEAKIAAVLLGDRIAQLLPRATTVQAPLVINAHPIYFPVASDWLAPLLAAKVQVLSPSNGWTSWPAAGSAASLPRRVQLLPFSGLSPASSSASFAYANAEEMEIHIAIPEAGSSNLMSRLWKALNHRKLASFWAALSSARPACTDRR